MIPYSTLINVYRTKHDGALSSPLPTALTITSIAIFIYNVTFSAGTIVGSYGIGAVLAAQISACVTLINVCEIRKILSLCY